MKIVSFSLLTVLSLVYAALTLAETMTYHKWEKAVAEQQYTESKLIYFRNLNTVLQRLARQLALDSQNDPALVQVLKDNKIKVVIEASRTVGDTTGTTTSSQTVNPTQSPDKPVQPSAGAIPPNP